MPQKALGAGTGKGSQRRKNAPQKRVKPSFHDKKGTKVLNKILEQKAAAKALKNESKFNFELSELTQKGKEQVKQDEAEKKKKQAKKRQALDRQIGVVETHIKRSKN